MTNHTHARCPQCGIMRPGHDRYCSICGASLDEADLVAISTAHGVSSPTQPGRRANWPLIVSLTTLGILILFAGATVALLLTLLAAISPGGYPVSAPQHDLTVSALGRSETIPIVQDATATQVEATIAAVAQPSVEPHSTSTPISESLPTHPPNFTLEPVPEGQQQTATDIAESTATSRSQPSKAQTPPVCTLWRDAGTYLGTHQCFCGTVVDTYQDPGSMAFFINFDQDRSAFYAVSFDWYREDMEGECIQICGTVESYEGRPQIVIRTPESQVFDCP